MKKRIAFLLILCLSTLFFFTSCQKNDIMPGTAEVTVKENGKKITVTVAPTPDDLAKYDDSRIYLFALEPGRDISDVITGKAKPIDDKRAKSTVKFKLDTLDVDGRSRLYYGFIAAFFDSSVNKFVPAANTVAYVSNPEVLSQNDTDYAKKASIKGINAEYDGDAVALDVSHVIIDIPIDKYARTGASENNLRIVKNGRRRYILSSALDELDARVKYYTENGITVYFRITLESSYAELPEKLRFLAFEDTVSGAENYPINTANQACAEFMVDFLDFLAERYTNKEGSHGLVSAFIAGHALNTPGDGVGSASYEAYLEACTVLLRTMYTAMATHYENGRVFLTVDRNYTVSGYGTCDVSAKRFLSDIKTHTKASGNYPWGIALSLSSTSSDSDRIWYDNAGGGKYITPVNLADLTDTLLSSDEYRYSGEPRHVIISDFSVALSDSEVSEQNQAASIAYAYYKAVATQRIDAFFYSNEVDTGDVKNGLRSTTDEGIPTEARPAYTLYSLIDSDAELDTYIGSAMKKDSDWNKLYSENYASAAVKKRSSGKISVHKFSEGEDPTDSYNYNTLYDFSANIEHSFTVFGNSCSVDKKDKRALSLTLGNTDMASIGYASCKEIKKSKLSNDSLLIALSLGEGTTDSYTVTLTIIQKNAKKGDAVYESSVSGLSGSAPLLLDFDVSEFRRELASGKLELRISAYCEDSASPSCELRVTQILIGKAKSNAPLIILLTVLAVTAITLIVLLSVVWFKRSKKNPSQPKNEPKSKKLPNNTEKRKG